ncbi:MAG TPA: tetratricopeptide repeat protein [Thermoanaerobaculia bacterium]|nr:tetratricopeptide repeat protein [Thermoanaerobaculia bacterium]
MRKATRASMALAAFGLAALVFAGAQARLKGKVTDSSGKPIEGASVTITTPNLRTFKMTLKSDKKGDWGTILNDATMPYHVKIEMEGYAPSEADKKVPVGDVGEVNAKLMTTAEAGAAAGGKTVPAPPSPTEQAALTFNEGVDLLSAGNKAAAEAKFLEAVGKNPDLPQGWHALASLAYDKKDWAKTLEYGQKALDLDPSINSLYGMMSTAAAQSGDKKAAAQWQAKFEEANPDTAETLYNKGIDSYNKKKIKEAEALLSKAVEAKPDFALAHFWLGMTSFNLNKKAAAKEHLEKYLELDPNGAEAATAKEILPLLK